VGYKYQYRYPPKRFYRKIEALATLNEGICLSLDVSKENRMVEVTFKKFIHVVSNFGIDGDIVFGSCACA
jgi:hypothetical protein